MTGAELHANIVETLLTGRCPRLIPTFVRIVWLLVISSIGIILFFRMSAVYGFVGMIILWISCLVFSYISFHWNWILPASNVQLALGLSYIGSIGFRLTKEERIRSHLREIFRSYVSDVVIENLLESGKLPNLGGETLNITVLFSDIRNFTTISEKLQPNEVVELLNTYYGRVCEPILNQGGMVDKFIGDAVMAIFGAPVSQPDQAQRALVVAQSMVEIAGEFQAWINQRFPDKDLPAFRIGIGLHSGEAVIGNIGSSRHMGYTAIGDTVNIASRLESMSKQLGWTIVASEYTISAAQTKSILIGRRKKVRPSGRLGEIEVVEILVQENGKEAKDEKKL